MEEHLFIRGLVNGKDLDAIRLAEFQAKRDVGDRALMDQLIDSLSTAIRRDSIRFECPDVFNLPENCMLWQWLDVCLKAIQHTDFLAWAAERNLDLKSLRVQGGTLYVNVVEKGVTTPSVMTLHDDSGWWKVADPINAVVQIIDPAGIDEAGIRDLVQISSQVFSLRTALAFYGYPLPVNRPQAHVMIDELRRLSGFPVIDGSGHVSTSVSVEQTEQVKDCARVASELESALQAQATSNGDFDFLEVYRRRVKLESGSMLSLTMISALRLLQSLSIKLNGERLTSPSSYYFSRLERTLMELDPLAVPRPVTAERLSAPQVANDFRELAAQAEKLDTDVYPDGCFSLTSVLAAYGRETPSDVAEVRALILSLGQAAESTTPYVHESAHSVAALLMHLRYIGLLNTRYWMGFELEALSRGKADAAAVSTVDAGVSIDPDSPLAELTVFGKKELLAIMKLNEFIKIRDAEKLDPDGHVLVTASGYVGGRRLDGTWADLDRAVKRVAVLSGKFASLALIARRLGGSLRSRGEVTLEQALKFYSLTPPVTAKDAQTLEQRLQAVPLRPRSAEEYWNALGGTFASVSSPLLSRRLQIIEEPEHFMPRIGTSLNYWLALKRSDVTFVLSSSQRHQVREAAVEFMDGGSGLLFDYLAGTVVQGKDRESVRAEADLLLAQILAGPRAQNLAGILTNAVTWQGEQKRHAMTRSGRHSLVLAAAILSLDPQAGQTRNRIVGIDLADEKFWSGSYGNLLRGIELALESKHGMDATSAPLAAHLLLSGVAPECLVRNIPGGMAYMTGQMWVHFKHCVAYLEGRYPGSSRRLTFDEIMSGDRLRSMRREYWVLKEFSGPVVDWASANGFLPEKKEVFSDTELARAKAALRTQSDGLRAAIASFHRVFATRRALALADLRRVYPGNDSLENKVLARLPNDSQDVRQTGSEHAQNVQKASFVDLHLSAQLTSDSNRWYSTLDTINYPLMAERFSLLSDVNQSYGDAFNARDIELWSAYVKALQYGMSLLVLEHRKRLEYGALTLFVVKKPHAGAMVRGENGIIVFCQHPAFTDCAYEFFPRQMMIVPRLDLNAGHLPRAAEAVPERATTQRPAVSTDLPVLLPLDWAAYGEGVLPVSGAKSTVVLDRCDHLALMADQASVDADALSVPRTLVSDRIRRLASSILNLSLFATNMGLRASAGEAISLDDAISGRDPWFEYLQDLTNLDAVPV